jgi:hypothetical protein
MSVDHTKPDLNYKSSLTPASDGVLSRVFNFLLLKFRAHRHPPSHPTIIRSRPSPRAGRSSILFKRMPSDVTVSGAGLKYGHMWGTPVALQRI